MWPSRRFLQLWHISNVKIKAIRGTRTRAKPVPITVMPPRLRAAPGGWHHHTMTHTPPTRRLPLSSSSSQTPWGSLDTRQPTCHTPPAIRSLSWSSACVYVLFPIITLTSECIAAAKTGFRLFSIQQRLPKQPRLGRDNKMYYNPASCPCATHGRTMSTLSKTEKMSDSFIALSLIHIN